MVMKAWALPIAIAALFSTLSPEEAKAEIRGLYGTRCLQGNGISAVKDLVFRGQTLETVQTVYKDLNCESPAYDFSFSGPYDLDEERGFLDYGYASIKLQALTDAIAEEFNQLALCGYQDWTSGSPKEVSGLDCGDQLIPAKGVRAFDLISEDKSDGSIKLGFITDERDGLSRDERPVELEDFSYYPK